MKQEHRAYPSDIFVKQWDPIFSQKRNFKEDGSYVEFKRRMDADAEGLSIFLQDFDGVVPSCQNTEIEEYCEGSLLVDLQSGNGSAGHSRSAWMDDRCSDLPSDGYARHYLNPLTATGLYRALKERV